ncbi:hypothetical protein ABIB40_002026 [Pedobacter sp. UYP30]|uniref:hypothetical protein n=1 Tax=Pedobacter sp. UYP30 TaxID=1756400 RepID=UPI003391C036
MKKIILAFFAIALLNVDANAQKKKTSGAIEFETTIDPSAVMTGNGIQLSPEMMARIPSKSTSPFELLFTPTQASYMGVQETEDSNGGGGGGGFARMMSRFGGGAGSREYYYTFPDKKLTEVFDLSDTTYYMQSKLNLSPMLFGGRTSGRNQKDTGAVKTPVAPKIEVIKTDSTKEIIGFKCKQVLVKFTRKMDILGREREIVEETQIWYTDDLGFDFSPNPSMWTQGAVLAIIGKGSTTIAKSIDYRHVASSDVTAPKRATLITQQDYETKQKAVMAGYRNRFGGGQGRRGN